MALLVKHIGNDTAWGIWKIEEAWEVLAEKLPQYRQQIEQFKAPHRRQEWLAARALIASLCGNDKVVANQPDGKPYLTDNSYAISLSHTRGYAAAVATAPGKMAGIDIEQYNERVRRVAHKFMRPDEKPSLLYRSRNDVPIPHEESDTWSLLLHWSAKESMFKCLDTSEVDFREHLHIFPFRMETQGKMEAQEYRTPARRQFGIFYTLHPDFVLTLIE
jgi:phosphopantetheinyl transferase